LEPQGDGPDEQPARLRATLIDTDGVASDPVDLWAESEGTSVALARIERFRDGRERIAWVVHDESAMDGGSADATWSASIGQDTIGEPEQVEELTTPVGALGDPGSYGTTLELNTTDEDSWTVVMLTRYDDEGHAQPLQILSDENADATAPGTYRLPSGDTYVRWVQYAAHQWEEECGPETTPPPLPGDESLRSPTHTISPEDGWWATALVKPDGTVEPIEPCDVQLSAPADVVMNCY
jgi:hypothetical protein